MTSPTVPLFKVNTYVFVFLFCLLLLTVINGYRLPVISSNMPHSMRLLSAVEDKITTSTSFGLKSWQNGYATVQKESVEALTGTLPKDIEGTFFRNGFGKFEIGKTSRSEGIKILHPFDADGLLSAVTMKDGKGTYRHSFIRTKGFKRESKTRQMSGRGTFGNHKPSGWFGNFLSLGLKNVANTNVVYWGERLLALWEGGLPYKMEPDSLRTLQEYTFKGLLKKGDMFTAHPRICTLTNRLIGFSMGRNSPSETVLNVIEFDKDLNPISTRPFTVPGLAFFHDFVVTKNYYIFNAAPLKFDPIPFALGQKAPAQCIEYMKNQPSMLYLIPRNGDPRSSPIMKVPVDAHFNFHFANAYEDETTNEVHIDVVWGDRMELGTEGVSDTVPIWLTIDYGKTVPYTLLKRYTLKPEAQQQGDADEPGMKKWSYSTKILSNRCIDFPSVNPKVSCQPHRYVFANYGRDPLPSASPLQGLVKLDLLKGTDQTWMGTPDEYLGEVVFAPKKGALPNAAEDDGYLLSFLSNWAAGKSEFVVFDASDVSKGPIFRSPLSVALPHGLHGSFANGLTYEQEDIISRWKACNSLDRQSGWNEVKSGFSGLGITIE